MCDVQASVRPSRGITGILRGAARHWLPGSSEWRIRPATLTPTPLRSPPATASRTGFAPARSTVTRSGYVRLSSRSHDCREECGSRCGSRYDSPRVVLGPYSVPGTSRDSLMRVGKTVGESPDSVGSQVAVEWIG